MSEPCKGCGAGKGCLAYEYCACCGKCRNCGEAHGTMFEPWPPTQLPQPFIPQQHPPTVIDPLPWGPVEPPLKITCGTTNAPPPGFHVGNACAGAVPMGPCWSGETRPRPEMIAAFFAAAGIVIDQP